MIESRRSYNNRCYYWKVDKQNPHNDKTYKKECLEHKNKPSGLFFAKESQMANKQDQLDSGILAIPMQRTVIESMDDLSKLDHKDLVEYLGEIWIVDGIESKIRNKTTEYYARPERIWYITLRNGK